MSRDAILWTSILAGPIVWLVSFQANFALVPWACLWQAKAALYLVSLVALVACAVSGLAGWKQWKALGESGDIDGGGPPPRARMMALSGVALSAGFFMVIVAQAIPEVILRACQ